MSRSSVKLLVQSLGLGLAVVFTVAVPSVARALPLKAKLLTSVRLRVNGEGKPGYQLRPEANGWRMKLELADALARVDVIDVTPGTPARTWSLRAELGQIMFDGIRFEAGHVYRISVAGNAPGAPSASTYVYLTPSPVLQTAPKTPGKVDFNEGEKAVADDSDLLPVSKGSL